jgi:predicted peptidase
MLTAKNIAITSLISGFWEYKPDSWDGKTKLPAFIFIHGLGDVGTDLNMVLRTGLPRMIKASGTFPVNALVIMPQYISAWPGSMSVQAVINYTKANYPTDRIFLTGLSMGGGSVIDWIEAGTASDISAITPVCTASSFRADFAAKLVAAKMPMFFTHGDADPVTSFNNAKGYVDGLNAMGITPAAKLWRIAGGQHNIWDDAYEYSSTAFDGKNMYQWCLDARTSQPVTPPPPNQVKVEAEFSFPGGKYTLTTDGRWTK